MRIARRAHKNFSRFVIFVLLLNGCLGLVPQLTPVQAQRRVIVVKAEQPNVWTLEQAHYLLAQMHRRNLDLRAKKLEDLDPNEINGLRFEVFKQLIEFGATFNQADMLTNQLVSREMRSNSERRLSLGPRRDKLRDESLDLTREISELQRDKARATTEEDKARIDEEIAAKTTLRDRVDKEIELSNDELKTAGDGTGELKATTGGATFDPNKLPTGLFDKAVQDAAAAQIADFNEAPRLNASLRLDNFLQMQYEIIAKQLTLLRDELGPGERLLFLELPQTLNVTHHEADKKWAQSWWRIAGYIRNCNEYDESLPRTMRSYNQPRNPCTNQRRSDNQVALNRRPDEAQEGQRVQTQEEQRQERTRTAARVNQESLPEPVSRRTDRIVADLSAISLEQRLNDLAGGEQYVNLQRGSIMRFGDGNRTWSVPLNERTVRTVELIPRQSSLNVNDMKLNTRAGAFNFVLSTLFGFGSQLSIQRQREQFSQFVQQELYSSAFGKGSREFGWTFTPMPGTDRLMAGVRTTYAVVVVPEEATSLILESNGCYFPRSSYQPIDFQSTQSSEWRDHDRTSRNCSDPTAFLVPIPVNAKGENNFIAEGITYQPVPMGERIVVSVHGYNFSSQMGVLINGSPLTQAIGLAQPFLRDDSSVGGAVTEDLVNEKVHGRIERIDSEQMVFSFEMPPDYDGTPTITLIAPGKAIDLNRLTNLYINGVHDSALTTPTHGTVCSPPAVTTNCITVSADMFVRPAPPNILIDAVEAFRSQNGQNLTVIVTGKGFNPATHQAFVNGHQAAPADFISPTVIRTQIPTPPDDTIQVVLMTPNKAFRSTPIPNPAYLMISKVTVVSYEPASRNSAVAVLVVRLEGSGFSNALVPSNGVLTHVSPTQAFLRLENPGPVTPLVLTDSRTGFEAKTVIVRKSKTRSGDN